MTPNSVVDRGSIDKGLEIVYGYIIKSPAPARKGSVQDFCFYATLISLCRMQSAYTSTLMEVIFITWP